MGSEHVIAICKRSRKCTKYARPIRNFFFKEVHNFFDQKEMGKKEKQKMQKKKENGYIYQ